MSLPAATPPEELRQVIIPPVALISGPGWVSQLLGGLVIALMIGIQISGNYGTFNLLCVILSFSLLGQPEAAVPVPTWYEYALPMFYGWLGVAALPWDSFTALTWCFSQR